MLEVDPEIPDVDDPEEIPEEDVPLVPSDTKPGEEIPDENVPLGNPATGAASIPALAVAAAVLSIGIILTLKKKK